MMFQVHLQQYVEKTATMEIEAETMERAIEIAKNNCVDAAWMDGEDAYDVEVYAVGNDAGDVIWER